ncbi:helix-turn-helix domain-containing protein [Sulfuriroseicoccus oceanibius]|uniref:Helix-turn-helix domain-containing protein n=1 Tax=Sulfuriroseicoccus oceanibius TaxID=2707525 RepID=A0A6B3L3G1_9BACT|nr:helix-turn-helix domain-containing protein [Sulfuriroseicoccus oceanibius]QQL45980.1 helix-turn-helix domain-containing protein [Sulfuriroseicoccus oceanibius]
MIEKSDSRRSGRDLFEQIVASKLFGAYRKAFESATGLPLRIVRVGDYSGRDASVAGVDRNAFCTMVRETESGCAECVEVNRVLQNTAMSGAASTRCFAGLVETMVPVHHGGEVIAFLRTGEVRDEVPSGEEIDEVVETLHAVVEDDDRVAAMVEALKEAPTQMTKDRYAGVVSLLEVFSEQLSEHLREVAIRRMSSEPESVRRALEYIEENLEDPIQLEAAAKAAGLSVSAFSRAFKASTGLTLIEYVNRKRIEWARRELLRRDVRVSEIAYKVGFSSLSQFNRTFSRVEGISPTQYRKEKQVIS